MHSFLQGLIKLNILGFHERACRDARLQLIELLFGLCNLAVVGLRFVEVSLLHGLIFHRRLACSPRRLRQALFGFRYLVGVIVLISRLYGFNWFLVHFVTTSPKFEVISLHDPFLLSYVLLLNRVR